MLTKAAALLTKNLAQELGHQVRLSASVVFTKKWVTLLKLLSKSAQPVF